MQHGKRKDAQIVFNTSLGVLFGVKKYADALWKVVEQRGIDVNLGHQLVEVRFRSSQTPSSARQKSTTIGQSLIVDQTWKSTGKKLEL